MVPASDPVSTLIPLIVAVAVTCCTIITHALALGATVRFVRHQQAVGRAGVRFWTDVAIVSAVALLALTAHLLEITLWAAVFVACGEFPHLAAAFYHSAENYTSLGYGDIVMSPAWKLLGPLETADGMLMFGVSTAMIFAVIQRLIQAKYDGSARHP